VDSLFAFFFLILRLVFSLSLAFFFSEHLIYPLEIPILSAAVSLFSPLNSFSPHIAPTCFRRDHHFYSCIRFILKELSFPSYIPFHSFFFFLREISGKFFPNIGSFSHHEVFLAPFWALSFRKSLVLSNFLKVFIFIGWFFHFLGDIF